MSELSWEQHVARFEQDVTRIISEYMRLADAAQEVVRLGNKIAAQLAENGAVDPDLIRWYEDAKNEVAKLNADRKEGA